MSGLGNGYWLNYDTNESFKIDEHEHWLRYNFDKVHVNEKDLSHFKEVEDRIDCLLYILKKYPLVRIREHGSEITFEFMSDNVNSVLWSIYLFLKEAGMCGDYTGLNIINVNKDEAYLTWKDFQERMKSDEFIINENKNLSDIFPVNCKKHLTQVKYKSKFNELFENIMKDF